MTCQTQLILNPVSVSLRVPADQPQGYHEVVDITGIEGKNPSLPIAGLQGVSQLQISSWILDTELPTLFTKNPDIQFTEAV